ncbi:MAG: cobalt-precorrin-6A reductase [Methylocystaceae bacterium]|nr:cobalt-precorrin-6A reductase [Methylocystaceae bacterium]
MPAKKLLILGGTGEAAELAREVVQMMPQLDVTVSYFGVTGHQPELPCHTRVGGFGGPEGLIAYMTQEGVNFLIDATHPFAEKISMSAYVASNALQCPVLAFKRPPWVPQLKDKWLEVANMADAVEAVERLGKETFLTIGVKELSAFADIPDVNFLVRLMNEPKEKLPLTNYKTVIGRPPFDVEDDRKLIRDHRIRLLVTKNSGGDQTKSKLEAARLEGIAVIMIERPAPEPMEETFDYKYVFQWLNAYGA